ncbi:MAG: MBL fold metallo-hydrolase [Omnitrophica WOR_2 bacterium]
MKKLSSHLYFFEDTCNVYAVVFDQNAVLIDFGSGAILDILETMGIRHVTDVLMTHHHRDQGQGLPRALAAGARIWAPHAEQDLFAHVEDTWQSREIYNNYNVRQDRFSLLEPVAIAGTLKDYEERDFGGTRFTVLPTPGHTPGSITLLAEIDGQRLAFSGDLIAAPGQVWSQAATQWTYNGAEGMAASIPSLLDLKAKKPDVLLPSHGDPMQNPDDAIQLLAKRLWHLLRARGHNLDLISKQERPYEKITPHLLRARNSVANTFVLLSESGKALFIDFGYDFHTGIAAGSDRASHRPWLHSLPALKQQFGVSKIDVVIPTHPHDDHVAGINLLRRVEGTQVWAAESFTDILENPARYDLPCLWYDPIPVDRRLPFEVPIEWEEYSLMLYPLPGHTHYAAAIAFRVDGLLALATGDQYQDNDGMHFNYVYQNRFDLGDYEAGARLYRQISPTLILNGHWKPQFVQPGYLDALVERAVCMEGWLRELIPAQIAGFGAEGFGARLEPYQAFGHAGEPIQFQAEVHNPSDRDEEASLELVVPQGWTVAEKDIRLVLPALGSRMAAFHVTPPPGASPARRRRVALDLTIGARHFGQQAEALVTLEAENHALPHAENYPKIIDP